MLTKFKNDATSIDDEVEWLHSPRLVPRPLRNTVSTNTQVSSTKKQTRVINSPEKKKNQKW